MNVAGELGFSVTMIDPHRPSSREPISGSIVGDGQTVTLRFSTTPSLLVPRTRGIAVAAAQQLDREGLTVRVVGGDGSTLAELGHHVHPPRWQRWVTRSPFIRLRSVRTWWRSAIGPRLFVAALPVQR